MKAVAQKRISESHKRQSDIASHHCANKPTYPTSFLNHDKIMIQRKSLCPCGGGCPRCSEVIQTKLKISEPNDIYEQEADTVADQVMRMSENTAISHQRSAVSKLNESVQTKPT